ncbi:uncharacterized protein LOC141601476 [Silene latifolia]|uniref:uncharacterized protein LOC141601476 n=1 Tax=Silene latifolia TaxID=37657 RepID=UPI003D788EC7
MFAASIASEFRQVCMCKGFGTTLTGPALHWYINLPNGCIKSFANLINQQFGSSRELEKRSSDLYKITQKFDEILRAFLNKFDKKKVFIPICDVGTAVEAFKQGLLPNSDPYGELAKFPCHPLEDVQAKTLAYIRLEENKSYKVGASNNTKEYEKTNKKSDNYNRGNNCKTAPSTRPDHSEVNLTQDNKRLDNMGPVVRWPRKVEILKLRRDQTKWCEFHMDGGHITKDCITLRKEVAYLMKVGYLKDLIRTRGRNEDHGKSNQKQKQERNLPPRPPLYEVKFINGGSEICGLTGSATKTIARTP